MNQITTPGCAETEKTRQGVDQRRCRNAHSDWYSLGVTQHHNPTVRSSPMAVK